MVGFRLPLRFGLGRLAWPVGAAQRWILVVGLGLSLVLVAAVSASLLRSRQDALRDGLHDASTLTRQLVQDAERALSEADLQLAALEEWLVRQGVDSPAAFERLATQVEAHDWLRDATIRSASVGGMFLVSADGRRLASSRIFPAPDLNLGDRDYFQRLRQSSGRAQFITAAVRNRQTGLDTVVVATRIEDATGRFMGIAAANIPAPRFLRPFEEAREQGLNVALIRRNGDIVVGSADTVPQLQERMPLHLAALKKAWARPGGAAASVLDAPVTDSQVMVTQPLVAYAMAILGTYSTEGSLQAWRSSARGYWVLTAVALMGLWIGVWIACRQVALRGQVRESAQLQAAHRTLVEKVAELDEVKRKLEETNGALESRVTLRTEQLSLALAQAQQANEAKSRFLSLISHELRTPLNAVLGFAQVLADPERSALETEQRVHVQRIEGAAEYLLRLINDLLDLGGVEQNIVQVRCEPIALPGLLRSVLETAEPLARESAISLLLEAPPATCAVEADPVRLHQVLLNLVSNAIKYNHRGGRVQLRCRALAADDTPRVAIEIVDSGQGLSESQLQQLFQPFNRLGAELTSVQGTGIGLVIARRLTELMQGHLEVHSAPGQGTTCTVTLLAANAPPAPSVPPPDVATPAAAWGHTLQVLYVEDHASNIALVEAICKDRPGVSLSVVRSGQEALEHLAHHTPGLLLMDMNLGDMTGIELKALIESHGLARGARLVALSADAMPEQIHAARAAGFDDYMTKPLRVRELLAQFERTRQDPVRMGAASPS